MKLHLPKQLFTALITAMFVSLPCTLAGDSISINFYQGDGETIGSQTEGAKLFGVDVTDWNDISASGAQTRELTVTTANEQNLLLTLTTPQASWGPGSANTDTLEDKLQASYLDVSANSDNSHWEIRLDGGDMWFKDITFYMAGDGGLYDAINVNGTNYVGGVNQTGDANWGDRATNSDGSKSYSTVTGYDGSAAIADAELNADCAVRVTDILGDIVAYNIDNSTGRGSLAGLQIVDSTDSHAYTATLGTTTADLNSIVWNKKGETTTLNTIEEGSRYLSLTADAEGSTLLLTANASIDGLHLKENNLTVSAEGESKLTVGALHANANTTLTMNLGLTGTNLALTGFGTISLSDYSYTGNITVSNSTTLHLQPGAQTTGQIINSGTVLLTRGNEGITLNSLVGKNYGQYKAAAVSNTSTGNLVIQHTGAAILSGNLTIANGGKVTLKGGTLGTADASITSKIQGENTELVLDGVDSYVGADTSLTINLHLINGTTLNLTHNDTLLYDDTNGSNTTTIGAGSFLNVGGYRQTVSSGGDRSVFVMAGGTIYGAGAAADGGYTAGLDFYNSGKITATENSLIATGIAARDSDDKVTFDVASGKTLTLGVYYVDGEAVSSAALVGNGSFVKSGAGRLSYQVDSFSHALEITGGEFEYVMNDDRTHTDNITGTGTFTKSGTGALTLDSAKTSVSTLKVNAGEIIYNSTTDTTHTLAGAAGSKFTKNGSGTLTVATESYQGDIEVSEGTLEFDGDAASSTNNSNREIAVQTGATLDVKGKARHYEVVLNQGATLTNTGAATGDGERQLHTVTLNGDATVSGTGNFYLINSGYSTTFLNLNQHKLTKTGKNTFYLRNTTVQSAGVIRVEGGTVETWSSGAGTLDISKASLEIADGGSFVLAGKNQQIQNLTLEAGGSLTVNNGLTLTAQGAAVMNGGSISGNLCLMGAVTFAGNVDLSSATVTAQGPVIMNGGSISGNLSLAGAITLAGDVDLSGATLSGTSLAGFKMLETAKPTSSGFKSLSYQLWEGTGNVTTNQESISVGGENYDLDSSTGTFSTAGTVYYVAANDTVATGDATAGATAFMVDGTLDVTADTSVATIIASSGTVNVASAATLSLSASSSIGQLGASEAIINLAAGTTLSLGQSGADAQETTSSIGTVNVAESAATIHLTEKATLNPLSKTGNGTITLTGSGTYVAERDNTVYVTEASLQDSANWTGTVQFTGKVSEGGGFSNRFGNVNSTIEMKGAYGWVAQNTTLSSTIKLTNDGKLNGFTVTDASPNWLLTISGAVIGNGDFTISQTGTDAAPDYKFTGNISGWSGSFVLNETHNQTIDVEMTQVGDLFAAESGGIKVAEGSVGTLAVKLGSANAESVTNMRGSVINESADAALNLTVQGNTNFQKDVTVTSMTVNAGKTATMNATLKADTVNLADQATISGGTMSKVQMSSSGISGTADGASVSNADVQIAQLAQDASFTIEDMTLTKTTIAAATVETRVNLSNVSATNLALAKGNFVVTNQAAVDTCGSEGCNFSTGSYSGITLANTGDGAGSSIVLNLGDLSCLTPMGPAVYDSITISLEGFTMSNYSSGILFAGDSWLGELLTAQGATAYVSGAVETPASVSEGGSTGSVSVSYSAATGGNVGTVITITGLNVPEPASATLGLAALMMLCARRRRKA